MKIPFKISRVIIILTAAASLAGLRADLFAEEAKPAKKKSGGLFGWLFGKDTGLVKKGFRPSEEKEVYGLDDCIKIAVNNHLPLQIAAKNVKLAEMRLYEARRNMLPAVDIVFQEWDGRFGGRKYSGRDQHIEGKQPVFRGGELYFTMKQNETNLEVAKKDHQKIRNELILQVKKGYYTFAKAKENLKIQSRLTEEVDRIYAMVSEQFKEGVASKLELLNVGSQGGQARYQFVSAEGDTSVAELILKQAMNIDPAENIEIKEGLDFKKAYVDFNEVMMAAFNNRPEIKINTLLLDYYKYGKGIAKAKGWPKIDMEGMWGLSKEEYVPEDRLGPTTVNPLTYDVDQKLEQQWSVGIKGSMPFWGSTGEYSWSRIQQTPSLSTFHGTESMLNSYKMHVLDKLDYFSDKQLAEIDYDKARQELIKAKQDVALEAKESCFKYEKALIQLDTSMNKVRYQEKDLEFVKLKREMDETPDSSVVESMIKLAQGKFDYLQALADCHISLASINKAIGIEDYFKDET